jgi:preprotein translocase subunit SecA
LLEFDDVANEQRKVFYSQRNQLMSQDNVSETISDLQKTVITDLVNRFIPPASLIEQWDMAGLDQKLMTDFGLDLGSQAWLEADLSRHEAELKDYVVNAVVSAYRAKEEKIGAEVMRQLEKSIMLQSVDQHWRDHLSSMDQLRQGIHLRGYAQKNPKQEYKRESFSMFTNLLNNIKLDVVSTLSRLHIAEPEDVNQLELERRRASTFKLQYQHDTLEEGSVNNEPAQKTATDRPFIRDQVKLGRNDPCHCGSGKKYKQCHGSVA